MKKITLIIAALILACPMISRAQNADMTGSNSIYNIYYSGASTSIPVVAADDVEAMIQDAVRAAEERWRHRPPYRPMDNIQYTQPSGVSRSTQQQTPPPAEEKPAVVLRDYEEIIHRVDMVAAVGESFKRGFMNLPRVRLILGKAPSNPVEGDLIASVVVTFIGVILPPIKAEGQVPSDICRVNTALTLVDARTGEVRATREFSSEEKATYFNNSDQNALENAIGDLQGMVSNYMWNLMPINGQVLDGITNNKGKLTDVHIDLGHALGVGSGLRFRVLAIGEVAGRQTVSPVGTIRVTDVLGPEISTAKVTGGKAEIQAALDAGYPLVVQSY